jgi:general secretion pathway protein J
MNDSNQTTDLAEAAGFKTTSGFTLIELLVALVLLSLMFLLLISGLQFGTKIWNEKEEALSHSSRALAVQDVVRRLLSEARPVVVQTDKNTRQQVFFVGTKNSVRFVAPMLHHLGMGGLYEVTLYLKKSDQTRNLEMSWRVFPQGSSEQQTVLLDNVANLEFDFFGAPRKQEAARWYTDWQEQLYLPELIRVRLGPEQLDFLVAPMVQSMNLIILDPDTGEGE